jgi:hypothetical protein
MLPQPTNCGAGDPLPSGLVMLTLPPGNSSMMWTSAMKFSTVASPPPAGTSLLSSSLLSFIRRRLSFSLVHRKIDFARTRYSLL